MILTVFRAFSESQSTTRGPSVSATLSRSVGARINAAYHSIRVRQTLRKQRKAELRPLSTVLSGLLAGDTGKRSTWDKSYSHLTFRSSVFHACIHDNFETEGTFSSNGYHAALHRFRETSRNSLGQVPIRSVSLI